jgi:hypothetical protein
MKVMNAFPGMGDPMNEEKTKNFMANNDNRDKQGLSFIYSQIYDQFGL